MDPAGKIALITGGASGLGRATARLLASHGAHAVIADVDETGGNATVALIEGEGGTATFLNLDVSRADELERAFDEIVATHGAIHIVHNNAALMAGSPDFPEMSGGRIAAMVGVNVTGPLVGTKLAIEAMANTGGGVVVNMSSLGAAPDSTAAKADPVYATTKVAVRFFTEVMASFAESHGVRVNAILPGAVDTPIIAKTGSGQPAEWLAPLLEQVVLLTPEDIAEAVLDLVRDDSRAGEVVELHNAPA